MAVTQDLKAGAAAASGQASRVSAAEKATMAVQAQPAVLWATVHVKRAGTGQTDTYEIVGTADPQQE